jgi:LL-diaminopimelate aminotransferase
MKFSNRLGKLAPYPFVEISRIIAQKRAAGADVVTFGIGDPDIPTPQPFVDRLLQASQDPPNHRYPETDGLPELRRAIAHWYNQRFDVKLDPDTEVLPLIGAKEGIGHVAFCFLDPGDLALVPDPAYPVYGVGTMFAGAESYVMPLYEENGWLPELDAIPADVARTAKIMWLNYPNNPTSAVATTEDFASAIAFCREHDIALLHDAAYSEVGYEGYRAASFLQVAGAREIGLEFHSLSKTYNMTGWRIGMAVGNAAMIKALFQIKANLDSGIPQSIQEMAIEALTGPQDCVEENIAIYQRRRDRVVNALRTLGLSPGDCWRRPTLWSLPGPATANTAKDTSGFP